MAASTEVVPSQSTLHTPPPVWWGRLGPDERVWLTIAFVWCLVMFTAMVVWQSVGDQRIPVESYKVDEKVFLEEVRAFIDEHQVGTDGPIPVVEPEPGGDAYIHAAQFQWSPVLKLQEGETYRLLISSTDVQHGLSMQGLNGELSYNFQVLPGYLYVIKLTAQESGTFNIVCNEFCGSGHHLMTGRMVVEDHSEH